MSLFDDAVSLVLDLEGVPTNDPNDSGGLTKFGVSQAAFPDINVAGLTMAGAKDIYRSRFWAPLKCDELPGPLALVVFDSSVNQGVGAAAKMLQESLRTPVDGVIGPETLAAAKVSGRETVLKFTAKRLERYNYAVKVRPTNEKFIGGWHLRALRVLAEAVILEGRANA